MSSPIVKATVQAVILSAISNVLAQLISCYRGGVSHAHLIHAIYFLITNHEEALLHRPSPTWPVHVFFTVVMPSKLPLATVA